MTAYLRERIGTLGGDPDRETLNIRKTLTAPPLYVDGEGGPWRCMTYVDGARSYETVESPAMLREAGRAFGEFQRLLAGYPAETLHETIAQFSQHARTGSASCGRLWSGTRPGGLLR